MDQLRLNQSDVILEMRVDTRKTSDIETLGKHFSAFILESLRQVVNLSDIVRYGVLFRLEECHSALQETPIEHFIQTGLPGRPLTESAFYQKASCLRGAGQEEG